MALFLDSANLDEITKTMQFPFVYGVTTNIHSLKKEGNGSIAHLKKIGEICSGLIFAPVQSLTASDILNEAKWLATLFKERIVIKIPFCEEGLKTIKVLNDERIITCLTAVANIAQIYIASQAGAAYVAVYVDMINEAGKDGVNVVKKGMEVIEANKVRMKLLATHISSQSIAEQLLVLPRVDITLPYIMLTSMIKDPITSKAISEIKVK